MRALAFMIVICFLLAGCAGTTEQTTGTKNTSNAAVTSKSTSASETTATTTTAATSTSTSATTAPGPNAPPTATLVASVGNGTVPMNVTFTINGADPDADALLYTFDADGTTPAELTGNGSAFPATFVFQYTIAGNYTATLSVSDGKNSTTVSQTVIALATGADLPGLVITGTTSVSGNPNMCEPTPGICSPGVALGARACAGFNSGENELDCVFGEIAANYAGHPYVETGTGSNISVDFWDSCDPSGSYVGAGTNDAAERAGTIPTGTGCAIMWNYGADPMGGVTLTLTIY